MKYFTGRGGGESKGGEEQRNVVNNTDSCNELQAEHQDLKFGIDLAELNHGCETYRKRTMIKCCNEVCQDCFCLWNKLAPT